MKIKKMIFMKKKMTCELNKEELDILNEAEQEIAETLTEDDFNDGVKKDNYEPTPIDLSLFDDNKKGITMNTLKKMKL